MANSQSRLIIILAAVFIAVILASGALIWLLPSHTSMPGNVATESPVPTSIGTDNAGSVFDLGVLKTAQYLGLDKQLIQTGSLPVQPPADAGKANPFL